MLEVLAPADLIFAIEKKPTLTEFAAPLFVPLYVAEEFLVR